MHHPRRVAVQAHGNDAAPKLFCNRVMSAISRVTSIPLPDVIPTSIWAGAEALSLRSPTRNNTPRELERTDFIFTLAQAAAR
jgi:hypothetical protein